ncbi:uncharacterized protein F5Z01DRAFT_376687 [Emericellopsis atlantica]|uniref:Rhodopsin domain-containing protein n=1 Tax=Emericellopsis atlantica TaxID=2614577 RepID=A0A9P7ZEU3_9HYPO|nr:uncharacterized protein F5Z01DRAFT_376687 [Emericellopsis atlantica]KAG9250337.1 hypothetical protein F5Z01DRAFT_376687 [Emericellopsis atlantica]
MSIPDHGPLMTSAIWPICGVSLLFLAARLYVRFSRNRAFWWDDWVLIASWVCLLGQTWTAQAAIGYGFGKLLEDIDPPSNTYQIALYVQVGATFVAFAISLSKISFAITLLRLTLGYWRYLVWSTIISMALLSLPAAILPWVQCRPFKKVFDPSIPGDCFDPAKILSYAIFVSAWNALMDFVLATLPWTVLWKLNMNRTEKMGVGVCMSLGVLAGTVAIVKSCYISQIAEKDFFYNGVELICWSAAETAAAIIAASIPVLRVFIREKTSSAGYSNSRGARRDTIPLSRVGGSRVDPVQDARKVVNEVWVTAHNRSDGESDKSILRGNAGSSDSAPEGTILQTNTFVVDTQSDQDSFQGKRVSNGSKD